MSAENKELPVWLYWEGALPDWIAACQRTVFMHANNVRLLTPDDVTGLRDTDLDIDITSLHVAHRADFVRAFLLAKYGGLWIDSDCIVMKPVQPVVSLLDENDFIGYKERQGYVSNNFMGARPGGQIAAAYYKRVCSILRANQKIEWLTLGSQALTATINESGTAWHEISVELIQPVCWSNPAAFFNTGAAEEHRRVLNGSSYCYMLSANMAGGFAKDHPSMHLLQQDSFFSFLLQQSKTNMDILQNIQYREGTDDDMWVIPEIVQQDMYRVKEALTKIEPATPSYVIDCGAHIGTFSIMCSVYLQHVEVISFEPNPDSFQYLSRNAEKFGHIRAYNKAVDIKDGTLTLYAPAQSEWSGRWTTIPGNNACIQVEAVDLFAFMKTLDKPVFIVKLDLEGYEELVINNATAEDLAGIQTIIVETHTDTFNHAKLTDAGFRLLFKPHISSARQFVYARL